MPAGTSFLIEKGMLGEKIRNVQVEGHTYYTFDVINQYLHAVHPIAWTRRIDVKVDGEEISQKQFFFVVRDQWIRADHIKNTVDIYWYLCEHAQIYVQCDEEFQAGKHVVECTFTASRMEETSIIDLKDEWPLRSQTVIQEMIVEEG